MRDHAGASARGEEGARDTDARDTAARAAGRAEPSQDSPQSAGRSEPEEGAARDDPDGATSGAPRDDAADDEESDEDFDPDEFEEEPYEPPQPAGTGRPGGSQALGLTLGNNLFGYVLGFHPIEIERYKDV